ncbi:hypothetical protein RSJ42_17945 [Methanosarcina hadiensis]|uniref:hypothetical protein n=1 Tax=Methanosarcina hadiensis TaxID=3078083 RepID=UPI0039775C13
MAMDFGNEFDKRWIDVIVPAVKSVNIDDSDSGEKLEPYRVDLRKAGDSINVEIITGINNCFLFFADLTTIGSLDKNGKKYACKNNNVMYEVGLATAVRLPEEVILFKSDQDSIPFDLASLRVNKYNPDTDPEQARNLIKRALILAIKELDLRKHITVKRAADSLTKDSWLCLHESYIHTQGIITHPTRNNMGEALLSIERNSSIQQLLELGIITAQYLNLQDKNLPLNERLIYEVTPFGKAVTEELMIRSGLVGADEIVQLLLGNKKTIFD